jgi:hypothetical protein
MTAKGKSSALKTRTNIKTCGIVVIITMVTAILCGIGIMSIYVMANDLDTSTENIEQTIYDIYLTLTQQAAFREITTEMVTLATPGTAQKTAEIQVGEVTSTSMIVSARTPDPVENQAILPITPLQTQLLPEQVFSCDCSKRYDCSDFPGQTEAQICFLKCGGSSVNNWSNLDSDNNGQACKSLTYP